MQERQQSLTSWLNTIISYQSLTALPADASFRRYHRVTTKEANYIVMDADPAQGSCEPFIQQADYLSAHDIPVPKVYAKDTSQGFVLLTDFGDNLYNHVLNEQNAKALYQQALSALVNINRCEPKPLGHFKALDADLIHFEMAGFNEWFVEKLLGFPITPLHQTLMQQTTQLLIENNDEQPQVFIHRDYHSCNLIHRDNGELGIIDFQDAMLGPITYDLASLLRDCYIDWPQPLVKKLALFYKQLAEQQQLLNEVSDERFLKWFDITGIERHLKAIFTFSRKWLRDDDPKYLAHIPRTLNYILQVASNYPELADFTEWMAELSTLYIEAMK